MERVHAADPEAAATPTDADVSGHGTRSQLKVLTNIMYLRQLKTTAPKMPHLSTRVCALGLILNELRHSSAQ